ncbi:MAG: hypothetical protein OXB95_11535 [Rhodobacteraceae bacterium]|nr:hypothetical protein [Paracoccaceae bacterium]
MNASNTLDRATSRCASEGILKCWRAECNVYLDIRKLVFYIADLLIF